MLQKQYAVSYVNFFDNVLTTKHVYAKNWQEALDKAFPQESDPLTNFVSEELEQAKQDAFDQDWLFDVLEIPFYDENVMR